MKRVIRGCSKNSKPEVNHEIFTNRRTLNNSTNSSNPDISGLAQTARKQIKNIQDAVYNVSSNYLKVLGWEMDDIADYLHVDVEMYDTERVRVEVRCELYYEELERLINRLDRAINAQFDASAYFEPVDIGIAEAYIELNPISASNVIAVTAGIEDGYITVPYDAISLVDELGYSSAIQIVDNRVYADPTTLRQLSNELADNDIYIQTKDSVFTSDSDSDAEDDLPQVEQEYDSAKTSINSNKLPAVYKMIHLNPGMVVVDYGGGKFDNAVEWAAEQDVELHVYDPYNRSTEHNRAVLKALKENGGADAAINSNVLNVIKEPEARINVLENIKRITKPGAPIYITVYEGNGRGSEGPTKSGYQLNRKTEGYLDEIREVFPDAKRKGKLIVATNGGQAIESATNTTKDYTNHMGLQYGGKKFSIYYNEVDNSPEADSWKLFREFKAQVSEIHPYDDADYAWANCANGIISIIRNGKIIDKSYYLSAEDWDIENIEWCDAVIQQAAAHLIKVNEGVEPKMIHYSTDIQASIYDVPERSIEPTEFEDQKELDDMEETIEIDFDVSVYIDANGDWTYDDESYEAFQDPDSDNGDWYTKDHNIYLGTVADMVDNINELLEPNMPMKSGEYQISGKAIIVYDITNVYADRILYEDSYGYEIDTDNVDVEFNYSRSSIVDFSVQPK